ncbi:hypothetical protein [Vibrio campbellii]|uniref:hypothetical protein n=1 Tax=Vibrio campbellii TaxID=680 RepID=UPI000CD34198|nr:hypothetical protein [Vibrio campbellii]AUW07360.1 hypothetical protein C1N51_27230 [Vibrio campbellii]
MDYSEEISTKNSPNREELLLSTKDQHDQSSRDKQMVDRNQARDNANITKNWARDLSNMDTEDMLKMLDDLPFNEKRTINNTSTVNRREAVVLNLAKRLSGKSIRTILVEECTKIVKENAYILK